MSDPTDDDISIDELTDVWNHEFPKLPDDPLGIRSLPTPRAAFYRGFLAGRASVTPSEKTITEQFEAYCRGQGIHTYSDLLQMIEDIADEPDFRPSQAEIAEAIRAQRAKWLGGPDQMFDTYLASAVLALLGVVPSTGNKETP